MNKQEKEDKYINSLLEKIQVEKKVGFWKWYFKQSSSTVPLEFLISVGGILMLIVSIFNQEFDFITFIMLAGGCGLIYIKYMEWWSKIGHKL